MTSISTQPTERLRWITLNAGQHFQDLGQEVIQGLSKIYKTLPCRYFYDDEGSQLFEEITQLPEYYLTRTEQSILEHYAAEIAAETGPCDLIELGSGSSRKTRLLLTAYESIDPKLTYCPIDISAGILKQTALELLHQYSQISVIGLAGSYEHALVNLPQQGNKPKLILFLGSTLGNMSGLDSRESPSEQNMFLSQVQAALNPGDFFLLGVDLQKNIDIVEAAYNDQRGLTAEFNLNILAHLNRKFGGTFALQNFSHEAPYNHHLHQIEMRLRSNQNQWIQLKDLDFGINIQADELIQTEISRKFNLEDLTTDLTQNLLHPVKTWTDSQNWFAVMLCQRIAG